MAQLTFRDFAGAIMEGTPNGRARSSKDSWSSTRRLRPRQRHTFRVEWQQVRPSWAGHGATRSGDGRKRQGYRRAARRMFRSDGDDLDAAVTHLRKQYPAGRTMARRGRTSFGSMTAWRRFPGREIARRSRALVCGIHLRSHSADRWKARMLQARSAHACRCEPIELGGGVRPTSTWGGVSKSWSAQTDAKGLLCTQLTGGSAPRACRRVDRSRVFCLSPSISLPRADAARHRSTVATDPRWQLRSENDMLLPGVLAKRDATARGAGLLFVGPDGSVREGASSNVFRRERSLDDAGPESAPLCRASRARSSPKARCGNRSFGRSRNGAAVAPAERDGSGTPSRRPRCSSCRSCASTIDRSAPNVQARRAIWPNVYGLVSSFTGERSTAAGRLEAARAIAGCDRNAAR